jgi:hypothetical protein
MCASITHSSERTVGIARPKREQSLIYVAGGLSIQIFLLSERINWHTVSAVVLVR